MKAVNTRRRVVRTLNIVLLCLMVLGGAFIGVAFALNSIDIGIGGKVNFSATDVYARVTGTVTGSKTENNLEAIYIDASNDTFTTPDSWKNMKFDFDGTTDIVLTIQIQNLSNKNGLTVSITDNIAADNVRTAKIWDGEIITQFSDKVVEKKTTTTLKYTWKVSNRDNAVTGDFSINITLTSNVA